MHSQIHVGRQESGESESGSESGRTSETVCPFRDGLHFNFITYSHTTHVTNIHRRLQLSCFSSWHWLE